ncbi:unnamed protein product [Allacma fusca]|uniref:Chitin-binding type-2 domain-containing protein n=1 Tax=Allacma fusca TaxID=39272 RepID=A0A8J2P719_9HEXA|nr:unnamed protein product [Allacma fusca]
MVGNLNCSCRTFLLLVISAPTGTNLAQKDKFLTKEARANLCSPYSPKDLPQPVPTTLPTSVPTSLPTEFRCPVPNVVYQDPLDCEYFYICIDSTPYRLQCLPGYAFDITKGYCCPKKQVATCLIDNILQGIQCPSDGLQPDKLDCTKFYWCYDKSATHMACPAGTNFDKNTKTCLPPGIAKCSTVTNP